MATTRARPPVIWLTCLDGHDHAVRDEEFTTRQSGVYEALCGTRVLPKSAHDAPRPDCAACIRFLHAWAQVRAASSRICTPRRPRRHIRPPRWMRLLAGGAR